jgi:hypothetical protein
MGLTKEAKQYARNILWEGREAAMAAADEAYGLGWRDLENDLRTVASIVEEVTAIGGWDAPLLSADVVGPITDARRELAVMELPRPAEAVNVVAQMNRALGFLDDGLAALGLTALTADEASQASPKIQYGPAS